MQWAALIVVVGVVVGSTVGWIVHRRGDARLRDADRHLERARQDLLTNQRSSEAAREVRDLILSSMQEGVLLLDSTGATAYANPALGRLLGAQPEGIGSLLPLAVREAAQGSAAGGGASSRVVETGSPPRWLRVQATSAGTDGSVLLVIHDVTEARHLDAIRRDFVANASHELKTPAASIRAAAETLLHAAHDDPDAVPRFAEQLEGQAVRLSRIVADLLDLSRLESGSDLGERVPLDALVREEGQRFEDQAASAELILDIETHDPVFVHGSARDLSLLVRNLIDNAVRHTRPGGTVTVRLEQASDGDAILSVKDTGIGIPQRDLSRIFERFYRVDRARSRETGGTGLGLSIVKHVVENHGGSVQVESELQAGTAFTVRLPCEGERERT
jgi:two-component system phosphate regulon sensor histidine kinase PhoR